MPITALLFGQLVGWVNERKLSSRRWYFILTSTYLASRITGFDSISAISSWHFLRSLARSPARRLIPAVRPKYSEHFVCLWRWIYLVQLYIFVLESILTATNDHDLADLAPTGYIYTYVLCMCNGYESHECFAIFTKSFFVALCAIFCATFEKNRSHVFFKRNVDKFEIVPMAQLLYASILDGYELPIDVLSWWVPDENVRNEW